MAITVDIDTGGTFTDGLFSDGRSFHKVKVETTPHDLTVGYFNCILEGAKKMGFSSREEFLAHVDVVRWTSTIASNVIAEKKGPKLGLIVSVGQGTSLYSEARESSVLDHLIERHNVEVVETPVDTGTVLGQIKGMLERGVRRICISLKGGLHDPASELAIKKLMDVQYPEHYLGNVPVLLGSDLCKHPDDMTRTNAALLNAYVHPSLARALFKAEDELKECAYDKPLLIGSIHGGVARVAKTKPMDTIESGPIFGIHAAAHLAKKYGLAKVVTLDVGGTTTKLGLVYDGKPQMNPAPEVFGIPIKLPLFELTSVALGGGTIARPTRDGGVLLGPQSMGAYPGPASYDLGGSEATLTDAFLLMGLFDPHFFAGGKKTLSVEHARKVLTERVADPLGISVLQAAAKIADRASTMIADHLKKLLGRENGAPGEHALFAFGGNGGLLGCKVAEKAGIKDVYVFELGPVLSAFGSSIADVVHVYEHAPYLSTSDLDGLSRIVVSMGDEARRDMRGEGFDLGMVSARLEFTLENGNGPSADAVASADWTFDGGDLKARLQSVFAATPGARDATVGLLRLVALAPTAVSELTEFTVDRKSRAPVPRQERHQWRNDRQETLPTHEWEQLQPGHRVSGPTVLEGIDTTVDVPRGWAFEMDTYRTGKLTWRER